MTKPVVVDADGHVLEPEDTWIKYIEPQYRARAIRIEREPNGYEHLVIDGKYHKLVDGILGILGGIGMQDDLENLLAPGKRSYQDGCLPGGYDPAARIQVLDEEQIDMVLLYPTIGIHWEGHVSDPKLADAYARAYNRYIVDFCAHDRKRLVPVAHINLMDVDLAIAEATRARNEGCVGIYLSPDPASRGGMSIASPALGRFYDAVADLDMPIGFHVVAREMDQSPLRSYLADGTAASSGGLVSTFLGLDVMIVFTQMVTAGVLARHPRLRMAVLETGSNWLIAWLDRMDHKFEKVVANGTSDLEMLPSEYCKRQCVISADPDETMTKSVVERLGDDKVIWASDYPHIDAELDVLNTLKRQLGGLPEASLNRILGGNCIRFYGLDA